MSNTANIAFPEFAWVSVNDALPDEPTGRASVDGTPVWVTKQNPVNGNRSTAATWFKGGRFVNQGDVIAWAHRQMLPDPYTAE